MKEISLKDLKATDLILIKNALESASKDWKRLGQDNIAKDYDKLTKKVNKLINIY